MIYIKQKFDLKEYLPSDIISGEKSKKYNLHIKESGDCLYLSYSSPRYNWKGITGKGIREYSTIIKGYVNRNDETFEVLGLLQAEMGKSQNGCIVFSNHEYQIIKKVMAWFEKEIELMCKDWRWYIKVNINEPGDLGYKKEIEERIIKPWLNKTSIDFEMRYPKTVSYIKNTNNKKLGLCDYGTLIIEHKNNILSQVIKKFVKDISYNILNFENEEIRRFMRGIIAGEGCIEINKDYRKYRLHITANEKKERDLYEKCLARLGIESSNYKNYKDLIVSVKGNLLELLKQKLVTLSHKKYNKFLKIFELYDSFPEYDVWKSKQTKPHNKIPQQKINKILSLYKSGVTRMVEIAEKVGVSKIKVNRVLRENNLGRRVVKTPEEKRKEIAGFVKENPELTVEKIAKSFNVSESTVIRAYKKYGVVKGNKARCKIPGGDIQKIIELYKENPGISKEAVSTI